MAKKVLIIEDYPATANMITEILAAEGVESVIAPEGASGIEKAETEKPALILLDIMLPGMSGLEVCSQLKSNPATRAIPVVMVSVKTTAEDVKAGMAAGADDYIAKPFDPAKLVAVVKKHLK